MDILDNIFNNRSNCNIFLYVRYKKYHTMVTYAIAYFLFLSIIMVRNHWYVYFRIHVRSRNHWLARRL